MVSSWQNIAKIEKNQIISQFFQYSTGFPRSKTWITYYHQPQRTYRYQKIITTKMYTRYPFHAKVTGLMYILIILILILHIKHFILRCKMKDDGKTLKINSKDILFSRSSCKLVMALHVYLDYYVTLIKYLLQGRQHINRELSSTAGDVTEVEVRVDPMLFLSGQDDNSVDTEDSRDEIPQPLK